MQSLSHALSRRLNKPTVKIVARATLHALRFALRLAFRLSVSGFAGVGVAVYWGVWACAHNPDLPTVTLDVHQMTLLLTQLTAVGILGCIVGIWFFAFRGHH